MARIRLLREPERASFFIGQTTGANMEIALVVKDVARNVKVSCTTVKCLLFSAVPAGNYNGSYNNFGNNAYFWSATQNNSNNAYNRNLNYNNANVNSNNNKNNGYSVRCLRDNNVI